MRFMPLQSETHQFDARTTLLGRLVLTSSNTKSFISLQFGRALTSSPNIGGQREAVRWIISKSDPNVERNPGYRCAACESPQSSIELSIGFTEFDLHRSNAV